METTLLKKKTIIVTQYRIQWEMKKVDTQFLTKTMANDTKEPNEAPKKTLNKEITEKFMEKILDMVNQNAQDALKKFQHAKNKGHEKTQKQRNSEKTSINTKAKQKTL
jgi:hypothetical protein